MRFSKGQGLSMNVIIIAALALLVLIILAVVLTGKFRIFTTATSSCESFGGTCLRDDDGVDKRVGILFCPKDYVTKRNTDCENEDKYPDGAICCIPLIEEEKGGFTPTEPGPG